ncbi:MAG: hypothetical protein ABIS50_06875 [Luteolibacter sp.]|uniref:hypothetical protein n=1 Tax=Luteolibacter sp. TaxID=1962973 RepID=UPI0032677D49
MNTYQDFEIILSDPETDLPHLLKEACSPPWTFDEEGSKNGSSFSGSETYRFVFSGNAESKPAWLVVVRRSHDTFYVPNLGPEKSGSFSHNEYNAVLRSFIVNVFERIPNHEDFASVLTSGNMDLSIALGDEAILLLRAFSSIANKNALHPNDRERFYDFVGYIHRQQIELDEETFKRWLVEEDGWSDEQASEIQHDFTLCQELLTRYDSMR